MDKRYQVFVSSTFADLKEERRKVMQALMEMDCIPAGMELFPALDEEQMQFIKRIIDDSDYYLLIIGGRYGSVTDEGISYTELEFDYAIETGKKVVVLIHKDIEKLTGDKLEMSVEAQKKLNKFKAKASDGRLVKFWESSNELAGLVMSSMLKTIKTYPAIGWVRGDKVSNNSALLQQLNDLRIQNEALQTNIKVPNNNLSNGADLIDIRVNQGVITNGIYDPENQWSYEISWDGILDIIGLEILNKITENRVIKLLTNAVIGRLNIHSEPSLTLDKGDFKRIKLQFLALNYIEVSRRGSNNSWVMTQLGKEYLFSKAAIKK